MKCLKRIFLIGFFLGLFSLGSTCFAVSDAPSVSSNAAVLVENSTSKVLFQKNSEEHMEPASVTKIMTAILVIENGSLNDIVTVPYEAISSIPEGYSIAELKTDEQLSVDELLQLMMVYSANDAANVLAFYMDGSIDGFANRMNNKLSELGLNNSHFTNPSGMHDTNHFSTAHDIASLMQYCIKNTTFQHYSSLRSCRIPATNLSDERFFENTNSMFKDKDDNPLFYPYVSYAKTGFTTPARYCLASVAEKDGLECTCVVLSSETSDIRFLDTKSLFEYGFSNFAFNNIAVKGKSVTEVDIPNGTSETCSLSLVLADNVSALTSSDFLADSVSPQITLYDIPSAPIASGKVLGYATYVVDGSSYSVDLVASHDVDFSASKSYFLQISLLIIVLVVLFFLLFGKFLKRKKI